MADANNSSATAVDEIVPGLPSNDYEQLTVARVLPRLAELTPSQLRRVLDFERRHANRRPVLDAIEQALAA